MSKVIVASKGNSNSYRSRKARMSARLVGLLEYKSKQNFLYHWVVAPASTVQHISTLARHGSHFSITVTKYPYWRKSLV